MKQKFKPGDLIVLSYFHQDSDYPGFSALVLEFNEDFIQRSAKLISRFEVENA